MPGQEHFFQVVQAGTASYAAGGFKITTADYEKIVTAAVVMNPGTKLATTAIAALELAYQANTATVKVFRRGALAEPWTELPTGFDLGAANFILTGKAI